MANITFIWCMIVLMDIFSISNGGIVTVTTKCDNDNIRCYDLYSTSPGVTWDEAYNECRSRSQDLASVSEDTQDILKKISISGVIGHAWIAGRSNSTVWTDMEGRRSNLISQTSGTGEGDCAALYFSGTRDLISHPCNTPVLGCICQTNTYQIQECNNKNNSQGYNISGICHIIPNKTFSSWSDARYHCEREYGGSLAYSVLHSPDGSFSTNHIGKTFWIGFHKIPEWKWILQDSAVPVILSQWSVRERNDGGCMYIDLTNNSYLGAKPCDEYSTSFICLNNTNVTESTTENPGNKTSMSVRPKTLASTSITSHVTTSSDEPATTAENEFDTKESTIPGTELNTVSIKNIYYIVGGSVAGLILLIVIILVVLCTKRKRKADGDHTEENGTVMDPFPHDVTQLNGQPVTDMGTSINRSKDENIIITEETPQKGVLYDDPGDVSRETAPDRKTATAETNQKQSGHDPEITGADGPSQHNTNQVNNLSGVHHGNQIYEDAFPVKPALVRDSTHEPNQAESMQHGPLIYNNPRSIKASETKEEVPKETILYDKSGKACGVLTSRGDVYSLVQKDNHEDIDDDELTVVDNALYSSR